MKRKLLITMLGVLTVLPALTRDFEYEYKGQKLIYTVIDEDARTVMTLRSVDLDSPGNNVSGDVIIPAIAKDGTVEYSVTSIGNYSFSSCKEMTSVIIPNSVTSIDWVLSKIVLA